MIEMAKNLVCVQKLFLPLKHVVYTQIRNKSV